jgi:BCD family chlorophyll transporter-like MFS transporter
MMKPNAFGWISIIRLGLVQAALGAIVVLTTSTLNRVMVVELALPALVPGLLVTFHHALQILRPRWGYGSDRVGRRTPWIIGGMACLAAGGSLAALATARMGSDMPSGIALAVLAYGMIGIGAGAAGTSLLAMLSERVEPRLKPAAATTVWSLMIFGFVLTAGIAGHLLDPFSPARLVAVAVGVDCVALLIAILAIWNVEGRSVEAGDAARPARPHAAQTPFLATLAAVWAEPQARRFTIFIFISMLAYSAQDLILEPFAGASLSMSPGQSTTLGGLQHGGVLVGMIAVAVLGTLFNAARGAGLRHWMVAGCLGSALALLAIAGGGVWPIAAFKGLVFALGTANGIFAAAAIASMMALASGGSDVATGAAKHDGTRIGLWGAAQALAFGLGGLVGTGTADLAKSVLGSATSAYAVVFTLEALAFIAAAWMAASATRTGTAGTPSTQRDPRGFRPETVPGQHSRGQHAT